jgi:hypothetical protein
MAMPKLIWTVTLLAIMAGGAGGAWDLFRGPETGTAEAARPSPVHGNGPGGLGGTYQCPLDKPYLRCNTFGHCYCSACP